MCYGCRPKLIVFYRLGACQRTRSLVHCVHRPKSVFCPLPMKRSYMSNRGALQRQLLSYTDPTRQKASSPVLVVTAGRLINT